MKNQVQKVKMPQKSTTVCQLILKHVEEKHPGNEFGETPSDLADGHNLVYFAPSDNVLKGEPLFFDLKIL